MEEEKHTQTDELAQVIDAVDGGHARPGAQSAGGRDEWIPSRRDFGTGGSRKQEIAGCRDNQEAP